MMTATTSMRLDAIPLSLGITEPAGAADFRIEIPPCGEINSHQVARLDGQRYENWPGFGWML